MTIIQYAKRNLHFGNIYNYFQMNSLLSVLKTALEVASYLIPSVAGIFFLFRGADSYADSYDHSRMKFAGISLKAYKIIYRILGVVLLAIAALVVWNFYMSDEDVVNSDTKNFWDDVNESQEKDEDGLLFKVSLFPFAIAIPARMASSRFPGKPLAKLCGKTVLERVCERCASSKLAGQNITVLTDSKEIFSHAQDIGVKCVMTPETCSCGTERIIAALDEIGAQFIVNVQGDEPFIEGGLIDAIIEKHIDEKADLVTAAHRISDAEELPNPNVVKVLRDGSGRVLYFSRSPLPYVRGEPDFAKWLDKAQYWRHIGVYGYSKDILEKYASLPKSTLEDCEKLEQLKFVSAGYTFALVETEYKSIGIDTPQDLAAAEEYLNTLKK